MFARHGAIVEIDEERAGRKVEEVAEAGGTARAHVVDVTTEERVHRLAGEVRSAHDHVDVLVNNVGDYRPLVPFLDSSIDSWTAMYNTNLLHVIASPKPSSTR